MFKNRSLNDRKLAMNDPALAAAVGALDGADFGGDFGDDDDFAGDFGADFGDDFGADFGDDFGADAAAALATRPTEQQAMAAWKSMQVRKRRGLSRVSKLDPNMMSDVSVERYTFSLSGDFTLGTAGTFAAADFMSAPDTDFRPQVLTANAPAPGFAYMTGLKMANVDVSIGPGEEDLFNYSAGAWGKQLDCPTLTPSLRARVQGRTTTFTPPGYTPTDTYTLCINFKGPAKLAGGGAAYRNG